MLISLGGNASKKYPHMYIYTRYLEISVANTIEDTKKRNGTFFVVSKEKKSTSIRSESKIQNDLKATLMNFLFNNTERRIVPLCFFFFSYGHLYVSIRYLLRGTPILGHNMHTKKQRTIGYRDQAIEIHARMRYLIRTVASMVITILYCEDPLLVYAKQRRQKKKKRK